MIMILNVVSFLNLLLCELGHQLIYVSR